MVLTHVDEVTDGGVADVDVNAGDVAGVPAVDVVEADDPVADGGADDGTPVEGSVPGLGVETVFISVVDAPVSATCVVTLMIVGVATVVAGGNASLTTTSEPVEISGLAVVCPCSGSLGFDETRSRS